MTPSSQAPLSPTQKRHLKSLGQTLRDHAAVHVETLSEGARANLVMLLEKKELLKIRLLEGQGAERQPQAEALAAAIDATLVQVVGRVALLYRANLAIPKADRILHGVR